MAKVNLKQPLLLEKKSIELEELLRKAKRKLLEIEILLSEQDFKKGRYSLYKKPKDFLKKL